LLRASSHGKATVLLVDPPSLCNKPALFNGSQNHRI